MGTAEVISFEEVRARKQWDALRGQLHTRFDQWLDGLEAQLREPAPTLAQVTETVWNLRQELTGGLTETIVEHAHRGEATWLCRKFCSGGHEGAVGPVCVRIKQPGSRTVRPQ
jgi:hypothetical protein